MQEKKNVEELIKAGIKEINITELFPEGWSVDKAKIKFILRNRKKIDDIMYCLSIDSRVKKNYSSGALQNSNYNFLLECKNGNVYIGLEDNANMNMHEARKTITIEYNPNKVNIFNEITYLNFLKGIELHRRFILYLDLAYDMHVNISDIRYKKRRKNEYRALHEHDHLETIYLKKLGTPNAVRIYDKTMEMNAHKCETDDETGEVIQKKYYGNCTRYEIRIKPEGKDQQLMFNVCDPFWIEHTVKLHELWLTNEGLEEKILKQIETYDGVKFKNLLFIHLGYQDKISDKKTRYKYINLYDDIKKSFLSDQLKNDIFKQYNTDCINKTINNYLDNITLCSEEQDGMLIQTIYDYQHKVFKS